MTSMVLFYSFSNIYNIWLKRRQLDSVVCFCIQSTAIFVQFMYMKKIQPYTHTHTLKECQSPMVAGPYFQNCYCRIKNSHNSIRKRIYFNRGGERPEDIHKQFTLRKSKCPKTFLLLFKILNDTIAFHTHKTDKNF